MKIDVFGQIWSFSGRFLVENWSFGGRGLVASGSGGRVGFVKVCSEIARRALSGWSGGDQISSLVGVSNGSQMGRQFFEHSH